MSKIGNAMANSTIACAELFEPFLVAGFINFIITIPDS
jgi:hypothetical protein